MQKKINRFLNKIVLTCLVINTLPLNLPMSGSALPKGQELVRLKQKINREISSVKKTIATLKKLKIIVPAVVFVGAAVITIVAVGAVLSLFKGFKKILRNRYLKKNKTTLNLIVETTREVKSALSKKEALKELEDVLKAKSGALRKKLLVEKILAWGERETEKLTPAITLLKNLTVNRDNMVKKIKNLLESKVSSVRQKIADVFPPEIWDMVDPTVLTQLVNKVAQDKKVEFFFKNVISDLKKKREKMGSILENLMDYKYTIEKITDAFKTSIKPKMDKVIEYFPERASELTIENLAQKGAAREVQKGLFKFELEELSKKEEALKALRNLLPPDESGKIARNSTIVGAFIAALFGLVGIVGLPLLSFLVLRWASIAETNKAIKRLEKIEKEFPGILTSRQMRVLDDFKKLSADPRVQGIIKSALLQAALTKTIDKTLKQHPSLVAALGGAKKTTKAFKNYIKLKWQEVTLQKAVDEYTATNMSGRKVSSTKRIARNTKKKIEKLEQKLVSKIKKAQLDVTQLKTALSSTAQSYIQQANAILEDLANQLIKAIEAGKINLRTEPVIEL